MILNYKNALATIGLSSLLIAGCSEAEKTHHSEDAHSASIEKSEPHQHTPQVEIESAHDDAPAVRSAESHVHGGAMLSIASENDRITIEFETPLYNILGFEYAPQTKAEKTLVSDVETVLAQPQKLIDFNKSAQCAFSLPIKDIDLFGHGSEPDDHDEEHHDEHDKDGHDDETSGSHKDVILTYELTCKAIENLKTVKVEFFDTFPNFTELDLVYLGQSQQMSVELSPSRTTADLTR